jgi:hypothetical protein
VADWKFSGTYLEACNCDPGCSCNFRGFPNSEEGNCEAFVAHVIESGSFDGIDLGGAKVAWAVWWPGAIHEGGGRGHVYIDCETDEQFDALSRIWRGEEGYSYFEIFNSTLAEGNKADRAEVDLKLDGKRSRFAVDGVGEVVLTPLTNPVSGDENEVRIVKPGGFIWEDGQIAQSETFRVDIPEMTWDLSGRHTVFSTFDYSSA